MQTTVMMPLRDAPFNLQGGAMVFRQGTDNFLGADSSPNIFLGTNQSSDFFFQAFTIEHIFFNPAYLYRGGYRKMADGGRQTQDDRRNRAKLRGQKAIIGG